MDLRSRASTSKNSEQPLDRYALKDIKISKEKRVLTVQQERVIEAIREKDIILDSVCLPCFKELPEEKLVNHPYFKCKVCRSCQIKLLALNSDSRKGYDGLHYNCFMCGYAGKMYCCDNNHCGKVFCVVCISNLCEYEALEIIDKKEKWFCFLCDSENVANYCGLLVPKAYKRKVFLPQSFHNYCMDIIKNVVKNPDIDLDKKVLSFIDINTDNVSIQAKDIFEDKYSTDKKILKNTNWSDVQIVVGGILCSYDAREPLQIFFEYYRIQLLFYERREGIAWIFIATTEHLEQGEIDLISSFLERQPLLLQEKHHIWSNVHTVTLDKINLNLE